MTAAQADYRSQHRPPCSFGAYGTTTSAKPTLKFHLARNFRFCAASCQDLAQQPSLVLNFTHSPFDASPSSTVEALVAEANPRPLAAGAFNSVVMA